MVKKGNENYSSNIRGNEKQALIKKLIYYFLGSDCFDEKYLDKFSVSLPININMAQKNDSEEKKEEYRIISIEEYARILKKRFTSANELGEFTIINSLTKDILDIDTEGVVYERYLQKTRDNYPELYDLDKDNQLHLIDLSNPDLLKDEDFYDSVFCRYNDILEIYNSIEDEYIKERIANCFLDEANKLKSFIDAKENYDEEITKNQNRSKWGRQRFKQLQASYFENDAKDKEF